MKSGSSGSSGDVRVKWNTQALRVPGKARYGAASASIPDDPVAEAVATGQAAMRAAEAAETAAASAKAAAQVAMEAAETAAASAKAAAQAAETAAASAKAARQAATFSWMPTEDLGDGVLNVSEQDKSTGKSSSGIFNVSAQDKDDKDKVIDVTKGDKPDGTCETGCSKKGWVTV